MRVALKADVRDYVHAVGPPSWKLSGDYGMVRNSLNHQQRHSSQKECQFLLFVVSIARIVANSWASNTTATPMKEVKQLIAAPLSSRKITLTSAKPRLPCVAPSELPLIQPIVWTLPITDRSLPFQEHNLALILSTMGSRRDLLGVPLKMGTPT